MADIPEGLDDLLNSIRGETSSAKSSALAVVAKAKERQEEDLVEEDIDPIILGLLGLDNAVDLDYGTYMSLLKEAIVKNQNKIPAEELAILANERKRIRGKTGRFTTKKKRVNTNTFFNQASQAAKVRPIRALPPAAEKKVEEKQEQEEEKEDEFFNFVQNILAPSLTKIEKNLEGILETLSLQAALEKKEAEAEEKAKQNQKRKAREAVLEGESAGKEAQKTAKKLTVPAMGILDVIKNFLLNTLLGGAATFLIDFLQDPAGNWDKMWKGLVNGVIGLLNNAISFLYDNLIMPINGGINAINDAIDDIETQINNALALFGQKGVTLPNIPLVPLPQIQPIPLAGQPPNQGGPITYTAPQMAGGGMVDRSTGAKINGMGADTQLVALSPGEVVMSNKAGDMYGRDNLLGMNAAAGGTNRPKMGKGVLGFQGGGQVGRTVFSAGHYSTGYNSRGIPVGSDNVPVSGTTDPGTGVAEYQATMHLIKTLQMLVNERGLQNKIGFENITSMRGLREVPSRIERIPGTQFVDLHFDQHAQGGTPGSAGRSGIISRSLSPVDRSLAAAFGDFGRSFRMGEIGVAEAGGTILELAAIDDPKIAKLLREVQSGNQGPHSRAMAERILNATLAGMSGNPPASAPSPTQVSPSVTPGGKTEIQIPPPVVSPSVTVVPVPQTRNKGSQPMSNVGANQSKVPSFSAVDANNFEMMVVKSIYNIVG